MARNRIKDTPPPLKKRTDTNLITQIREYKLITPLYGGSAIPGEVDLEMPIRGTEIRGHLRFWWRATRGAQFGNDIEALKETEDKIWGAASDPSLITISIPEQHNGIKFQAVDWRGDNIVGIGKVQSRHNYVTFPLREGGDVRKDITFKLRISFPKQFTEDVKAALWAWDTFGGIGARTRRGFGALNCVNCRRVLIDVSGKEHVKPVENGWLWRYSAINTATLIYADIKKFVPKHKLQSDVPYLNRDLRYLKVTTNHRPNDPLTVWEDLFGALKNFRQSRFTGSRTGRRNQGRSHWPEPDAIRDLTGQALTPDHSTPIYSPPIQKFPRAEFGLPIIFEFVRKDSHPNRSDKDPKKTSLEGEDHSRLASPLILRPLACEEDQYVGLVLILDTKRIPPSGLALKNAKTQSTIATGLDSRLDPTTTPSETDQISRNHPDYNRNPDILLAFLATL